MEGIGHSGEVDDRMVADHEANDMRLLPRILDRHIASDQRVSDAGADVADDGALKDDRLLYLAGGDFAIRPDGGERSDVGIDNAGAGADDRGAANRAVNDARSRFKHDLSDEA